MGVRNFYIREELNAKLSEVENMSGLINNLLEDYFAKAKPANLDIDGLSKHQQELAMKAEQAARELQIAKTTIEQQRAQVIDQEIQLAEEQKRKDAEIHRRGLLRKEFEIWIAANEDLWRKEAIDFERWQVEYAQGKLQPWDQNKK